MSTTACSADCQCYICSGVDFSVLKHALNKKEACGRVAVSCQIPLLFVQAVCISEMELDQDF